MLNVLDIRERTFLLKYPERFIHNLSKKVVILTFPVRNYLLTSNQRQVSNISR